MASFRITRVNGQLLSGTGIRIKGRYALFHGREFIKASDDPEELVNLIPECERVSARDVLIFTVIVTLVLTAESFVNWLVPYV